MEPPVIHISEALHIPDRIDLKGEIEPQLSERVLTEMSLIEEVHVYGKLLTEGLQVENSLLLVRTDRFFLNRGKSLLLFFDQLFIS